MQAEALVCVGVTLWYGWGGVVSVCRLKPPYIYIYIYINLVHEVLSVVAIVPSEAAILMFMIFFPSLNQLLLCV